MVALSGRRTLGYASEQVVPVGCRGAVQRRELAPAEVRAAVRSAEVVPPSAARSDAREFLRNLALFARALLRLVFHLLGKIVTGLLVLVGLLLYLAGI